MAIAIERAPRAVNWIQRMDDLGWLPIDGDAGWTDVGELPEVVHQIVREAGSTYAPFMLANSDAIATGADEVVCEILGAEYRQAPFKYQAKCLTWLREAYQGLDTNARSTVDTVLANTGCDLLVA